MFGVSLFKYSTGSKNYIPKIERSILYYVNFQEKLQTKKGFIFSIYLCLLCLSSSLKKILTLRFLNTSIFIGNLCSSFTPLILNKNQVQIQNPSSSIDLYHYFNLGFSLIYNIWTKHVFIFLKDYDNIKLSNFNGEKTK